jgi:uncharacterized damage-inducible protein DinB
MCTDNQPLKSHPKPSENRTEINDLLKRLHRRQQEVQQRIQQAATYDDLKKITPEGFTINEVLRMWVWHYETHYRDLIRIRGPLVDDDPHFHIPHYIREANESFGKLIGELACMSDEFLDKQAPEGGRTLRDTIEHVLDTLENYIPVQIEEAIDNSEK